jgi:hypothetical protein
MRALLVAALLAAGCPSSSSSSSSSPADGAAPQGSDGAAYNECRTICLRPGDCAVAYSSDDRCPPGFLCARTFSCVADGGTD